MIQPDVPPRLVEIQTKTPDRQRQHQLYGSVLDRITGKASTKSLTGSGADLYSQTKTNR
ncbi:MAG TPA: hypothetical protein V6C85_13335 [Allocoleopsis sp.]